MAIQKVCADDAQKIGKQDADFADQSCGPGAALEQIKVQLHADDKHKKTNAHLAKQV